jgi:hypothetical protein
MKNQAPRPRTPTAALYGHVRQEAKGRYNFLCFTRLSAQVETLFGGDLGTCEVALPEGEPLQMA